MMLGGRIVAMVVVDVVVKRCVVVAVLSGLIAVVEGCGNGGMTCG